MCGVTGFFHLRFGPKQDAGAMQAQAERMTDTLAHRGPDDSGVWTDEAAQIALGFRRLSIIDLSPAGHQPMPSASGRYVIVFNGEVYNSKRLQARLEAEHSCPPLRGHSDTEIMLACIEAWGLETAVQSFLGMFAFALWDRTERVLHLVRDRLGIKPLYYGTAKGALLFGSELKALRAHRAFGNSISRDALTLLLRYNYIPTPYSIYENVWKLPPGTILSVSAKTIATTSLPAPRSYWSLAKAVEAGQRSRFAGSDEEAKAELHALLRDSVGLRMVADVPLGVFLSGGIDSSLVTALMQAQSTRPVRSFAIGFEDEHHNEAPFAATVARHIGTEHTDLVVSPAQALAVIPRLPMLYDEPLADSSQIPTFLVSQLACRDVTVSLSGDGGDELFAGYPRYAEGQNYARRLSRLPSALRPLTAAGIRALSPEQWQSLFGLAGPLLPVRARRQNLGHRFAKLGETLQLDTPDALYRGIISHSVRPEQQVRDGHELPTPYTHPQDMPDLPDFVERMMYLDGCTYLPDDILVKVDRASMGVGLEVREPLLDHRLVEFAWRLPLAMKMREGEGKWLLRQVLYDYVPRELVERPKAGFSIPLGAWLRGPLRDWAECLLNPRRIEAEGFLYAPPIQQKWREHLSGRHDWQYYLWNILMFQAWLDTHKK